MLVHVSILWPFFNSGLSVLSKSSSSLSMCKLNNYTDTRTEGQVKGEKFQMG